MAGVNELELLLELDEVSDYGAFLKFFASNLERYGVAHWVMSYQAVGAHGVEVPNNGYPLYHTNGYIQNGYHKLDTSKNQLIADDRAVVAINLGSRFNMLNSQIDMSRQIMGYIDDSLLVQKEILEYQFSEHDEIEVISVPASTNMGGTVGLFMGNLTDPGVLFRQNVDNHRVQLATILNAAQQIIFRKWPERFVEEQDMISINKIHISLAVAFARTSSVRKAASQVGIPMRTAERHFSQLRNMLKKEKNMECVFALIESGHLNIELLH